MNVVWYIAGVVSGFIGGGILGFAAWSFHFVPKMQSEQEAFKAELRELGDRLPSPERAHRLDTDAYSDESSCPRAGKGQMTGHWHGERKEDDGSITRWTNVRHDNGTMEVRFQTVEPATEDITTETGYWAYSNCLYAVIIKTINGSPSLYQEVYRVHELRSDYMRYTNFRTGNTFEMYRLATPSP